MKYLVLGASRGLGLEVRLLLQEKDHEVFCFSRTSEVPMDFTQVEKAPTYFTTWNSLQPDVIIYAAGGGPFGGFGKKALKDHEWAYRLNFIFPSALLHATLSGTSFRPGLKQLCFIGSAIAGAQPDPGAASYAAAKHALRGLVTSVQQEEHGELDIRLFSPGYMDTALLPANAWPRQREGLVQSPRQVAQALLDWLENVDSLNQEKLFE